MKIITALLISLTGLVSCTSPQKQSARADFLMGGLPKDPESIEKAMKRQHAPILAYWGEATLITEPLVWSRESLLAKRNMESASSVESRAKEKISRDVSARTCFDIGIRIRMPTIFGAVDGANFNSWKGKARPKGSQDYFDLSFENISTAKRIDVSDSEKAFHKTLSGITPEGEMSSYSKACTKNKIDISNGIELVMIPQVSDPRLQNLEFSW